MPIQSTDTTDGINFGSDYEYWVISRGVTVLGGPGVNISFNNCILSNHGVIEGFNEGVSIGGQMAYVHNGADGSISSRGYGVFLGGSGDALANEGDIFGADYGVYDNADQSPINNSGQIKGGNYGIGEISGTDGGGLLINSGLVSGGVYAVYLYTAPGLVSHVQNSGVLQGGSAAIADEAVYQAALDLTNTGQLLGGVDVHFEAAASSIVNAGSIQGDVIFGASGDSYKGKDGAINGAVDGGAGNDVLVGGQGDETLIGGLGRDRMDGGRGPGEDVFVFRDVKDSRPSGGDVITKHWSGSDQVDLSGIDANHAAGLQHLVFGGQVSAGAALAEGKVYVVQVNGDTHVVFDNNGDGKADFDLQINGLHTLTADSFIL